jgi:hypothetical protein
MLTSSNIDICHSIRRKRSPIRWGRKEREGREEGEENRSYK